MMWWYGPGGWMGGFGIISMIIFWVFIITLIVMLFRGLGGSIRDDHHPSSPPPKTPLQILQERYAKGEIDKKEYEEKKKDLS